MIGSRLRPYQLPTPLGDRGRRHVEIHVDPYLEPLRGYPPFDELIKPKG